MDERRAKIWRACLLGAVGAGGVLLGAFTMRAWRSDAGAFMGLGGMFAGTFLLFAAMHFLPVERQNDLSRRQRVIHVASSAAVIGLWILWILFFGRRLGWTHPLTLLVPGCALAVIALAWVLQRPSKLDRAAGIVLVACRSVVVLRPPINR